MSDRTLKRMAWSVCAVTLLVLAFALLLILLGWSTPLPEKYTPWRDQTVSLVGLIGAPILGGLIASRRPRNPYGWLWLVFGLGLALQLLAVPYGAYAQVVEPGALFASRTASRLLSQGGPLGLASAPFLLLLFPTGRLPSRRWRYPAWVAAVSGVVLLSLNILFGSPDKVGGVITAITFAVVLVIFLSIALSALSLMVRYRQASGLERQQLKWFAFAAIPIALYAIGGTIFLDQLFDEAVWNLIDAATKMFLYTAVGVTILRYRLYDIDILINRTLVYLSLTVSLALVYFGGVISLQALLRALTGQGSQLAIVASTLAIAALFNPLRSRIQDFIDRRFYRRKYDAAIALESFSAKLRDETDLDDLDDNLVAMVRETMQPEHISLWLRKPQRASREQAG